jgi:hypothetical protein
MLTAKKVYDYKIDKVKSRLVTALRRRKNESTIADLIGTTGLPKYQVQEVSKIILDEYNGQLKVTESGELLYYFPQGMHSRIHGFIPNSKRLFKHLMTIVGKALAFLFKVWIMVMLVGYFVLFLLILIGAVVLSIAASGRGSERSRSRGGGGAFFLVIRLLEFALRIFFWVSITKQLGGGQEKKPKGRPLYKSIFAYVFGEEDKNKEWEAEEKIRVISYIRANKGVVTTEELMILSGKNYDGAQQLINSYLLEFEGEPMVSDNGTVYFFFPELLRTSARELAKIEGVNLTEIRYRELIPFATNKGSTNTAITFFNIFNLTFGFYFYIFSSLGSTAAAASDLGFIYNAVYTYLFVEPFIFIILGVIPISFSILFFLIPLLRTLPRLRKNENIKQENLRKKIYSQIYTQPLLINPMQITSESILDTPKKAKEFIQKQVDELAGIKQAEFEEKETMLYNFNELKREQEDIAGVRRAVDLSKYEVGKTVFDSGE